MAAHVVDIAQDVVVPEAQNSPAVCLETSSPDVVIGDVRSKRVLRAVYFDNKAMGGANEIDDVAGNRHLSAEAETHQAMSTKLVPEFQFSIGHGFAHTLGICPP
ncbi:hypothetical protein GGQ65_006743 [Rhizobium fabae]|uniref:Uncharacterized protein n=1 Tax=Rhizobium fabae TaxID=573179 RepID=A0A7W6FMD3_9HYPH|nr:hypothetical protein [Rhizobium fabae]